VMLYEMLTGAQPHTGETPLAVAHKHVSDAVPAPSSMVPGLPPAVDALVAMATSRDPSLRPASAGQFLNAVSDVRGRLPLAAPIGQPASLLTAPLQDQSAGPVPAVDPAGFPWFDDGGQAAGHTPPPGAGQGAGYGGFPGDGRGPLPAPPDSVNHTLVVPAEGLSYDSYDGVPYGGMPYGEGDGPAYPSRRAGRFRSGEPMLQRWLFSRRLVYLSLATAVVVIVGLIAWWVTDGQYVTVPQVAGMAAGTAGTELQNLGFTVKIGPGQHSNTIGKGDVVQTDPKIGASIKRGATVTVIESTGPVMISVPNVTGLTEAAAQAELRKAGLTPGPVSTVASSTIPVGVVISTNPVAGASWPQPKPVSIAVSAGPPLPNFVGQQFSAAQGVAQAGGYQLQQQSVASSQPPQTIVGQSPAAGTPISKGEVVVVQVSSGPPQVAIPDVDGLTVTQATAELESAGFSVAVSGGIFRGHTVLSYSPTGEAAKGTTITLTLNFAFP
jgi:eukaryotic-like serine/threonine-protein kinase